MARRVSYRLSQNLLLSKLIPNQSSSLHQRSIKTLTNLPVITPSPPRLPSPSHPKQLFFTPRFFCSSNAGPSGVVAIKSEEELNTCLKKAKDESLPAIFYFTAAWCGPCRFISPVIDELSKKYPHVATYKIDIDQEGIQITLSDLEIFSVPTLYFFRNGVKASEVVGADIQLLKQTMEALYK